MKKTLIVFALVLAMVMMIVPMSAFAEEQVVENEAAVVEPVVAEEAEEGGSLSMTNPLYPSLSAKAEGLAAAGKLELESKELMPSDTSNDVYSWSAAVALLRSNLEQHKTSFYVDYFAYSKLYEADVERMWEEAMAHTGVPTQGDYIAWHWTEMGAGWNYYSINGYVNTFILFEVDYYTTASQEAALTNKVNQIIDSFNFTAATTDYEKTYTIYNWVTTNIDYDYSGLNRGDPMAQTSYKGVMQGTTVCQGYASTMYRMLLQVGVDCRVIAGDAESYSTPNYTGDDHGWNIAKINGKWYNLDATWDDENTPAYWEWFLLSPANFTYHTRWSEYNTTSFHNAYPMSSSNFNPAVYNGLVNVNGTWSYQVNGILQKDYTGMVQHGGNWYVVENGVITWTYTGLIQYYGNWYYSENSEIRWDYTGMVQHGGNWYVVEGGMVTWTYTGLVQYYGNWYYSENSEIHWDYTGMVQHGGNWYVVENGMVTWTYTGLVQYYGNWFYSKNSEIRWGYTGMVQHGGNWYVVESGMVTWTYTGLVQYYGNWYYSENSEINWNYTGLSQYYGNWYYVEGGMITWTYTGLVSFNGNLYYVQNSEINWNYNGTAWYNGVEYQVIGGIAQ